MMVYLYEGDFICQECADEIDNDLERRESKGDEPYSRPEPYPYSDAPQHCEHCGTALY